MKSSGKISVSYIAFIEKDLESGMFIGAIPVVFIF